MENFIKLQSSQGLFDTSGNKNLCDFHLPANSGSYNLSQSFYNVNVSITNTDTAVANGSDSGVGTGADAPPAVYNQGIVLEESTRETNAFKTLIQPESATLVKNARLSCARGRVEDIRRVDCLRSNLAVYKQSTENQMRNTFGMANGNFYDLMPKQPLNALVGEGVQLSEQRSHDIRIPVSSVFEMGKSEVWDTQYYGATKMNMELQLEKMAVINRTDDTLTGLNYLKRGATEKYETMRTITNGSGAGSLAVGDADYPLITSAVYESVEDSPFYVGGRYTLARASGTGTLTAPVVVSIKSITLADGSSTSKGINNAGSSNFANSLVIVLSCSHGTITNGQTLNCTLKPIAPATTPVIVINNIELVAKMSDESEDQPTQYTTYVAQEDTAPSASNISRTYSLPPNTTNCYVMFNDPIYSHENLDSYRITLDGVDLTNRDIKVKSGLHYDLLSQVFINRGQAIGSTRERMYDSAKLSDEAGASQSIVVLMFPVKLQSSNTQLGLELNATNGETLSGKIVVYSEVVKEI